MKPTSQFNMRNASPTRRSSATRDFPKVDYNYQPKGIADFNGSRAGGCTFNSPFRSISAEYFKHEARGEYALELALFGLVTVIATVPIIQSVVAMIRLLGPSGIL